MTQEQPTTKKISHTLTAAQQQYCRELVSQMSQIETTLRGFLAYIVAEAKLPVAIQGYRLSPDITSLEGELPADSQ